MSASQWTPVHHEEIEGATQTKPPETAMPLTLVLGIPPELIANLSSLSGTLERVATELAEQGRAIKALAAAVSTQHLP